MELSARVLAVSAAALTLFPLNAHAADTASRLTAQFAAMNGDGWTGGDASWSARLPDGRNMWLFGDTFVGGVGADGRRDPNSTMVRNSIVVEGRDGSSRTLAP